MKSLYKLEDKLFEELDEFVKKPEMRENDLDVVHKITDTIKNIYKICDYEMKEDDGYSRGGGSWEADMRGMYNRGSSYEGRGMSGRSTDYYSERRGGRYSRGGKEDMTERLHTALKLATSEKEREILREAIERLDD